VLDARGMACDKESSTREIAMESLLDSLLKDRHYIDGEMQKLENEIERLKMQRELLLYKRRLVTDAIAQLEDIEYESVGF
jgi:hypothetical protein